MIIMESNPEMQEYFVQMTGTTSSSEAQDQVEESDHSVCIGRGFCVVQHGDIKPVDEPLTVCLSSLIQESGEEESSGDGNNEIHQQQIMVSYENAIAPTMVISEEDMVGQQVQFVTYSQGETFQANEPILVQDHGQGAETHGTFVTYEGENQLTLDNCENGAVYSQAILQDNFEEQSQESNQEQYEEQPQELNQERYEEQSPELKRENYEDHSQESSESSASNVQEVLVSYKDELDDNPGLGLDANESDAVKQAYVIYKSMQDTNEPILATYNDIKQDPVEEPTVPSEELMHASDIHATDIKGELQEDINQEGAEPKPMIFIIDPSMQFGSNIVQESEEQSGVGNFDGAQLVDSSVGSLSFIKNVDDTGANETSENTLNSDSTIVPVLEQEDVVYKVFVPPSVRTYSPEVSREEAINNDSNISQDGENFKIEILDQNADQDLAVDLEPTKESPSLEKKFPCPMCKKTFARKHGLKVHMLRHTSKMQFKCHICNEDFSGQGNPRQQQTLLKMHIKQHEMDAQTLECTVCQETFDDIDEMNKHMHSHAGEEVFQCDLCDKMFTLRQNLKKHMLTHNDHERDEEKVQGEVHQVVDSPKSVQGANLAQVVILQEPVSVVKVEEDENDGTIEESKVAKKRKRSGDGTEKVAKVARGNVSDTSVAPLKLTLHPQHIMPAPHNILTAKDGSNKPIYILQNEQESSNTKHKCETCHKTFTRASGLRNHMLVHSGERPHKCNQCDLAFALIGNLKKHMLTHSGQMPYKCEVCNRPFGQTRYLNKHMLIHKRS